MGNELGRLEMALFVCWKWVVMVKYNVYRLGLDVPGPKHNFRLYGDVVWWLGRLSLTLFDLELVWDHSFRDGHMDWR